tara:strand:+ start:386 stop:589 length:204 start_codon:yes stop_codon:yes gene_type:complete
MSFRTREQRVLEASLRLEDYLPTQLDIIIEQERPRGLKEWIKYALGSDKYIRYEAAKHTLDRKLKEK